MSDKMTSSQTPISDGVQISLRGDIDFSCSANLRGELTEILDTKVDRLVIDLAEVSYMDSSGVAVLVEALRKQHGNGGKLVLCKLQQRVRDIFEISRLHTLFAITDSAEDAANV